MAEKAQIEVFKRGEDGHPYPWMFAVTYKGVRHEFCGIPNQCPTKRAATMRARWRAKWLEDGTYNSRYRIPMLPNGEVRGAKPIGEASSSNDVLETGD